MTTADFSAWLRFVVAPLVTKPTDVTVVEVHRSGRQLSLELRVGGDSKQNLGGTGLIPLRFEAWCGRFADAETRHPEVPGW